MLRISPITGPGPSQTLKVEGQLVGPWVGVLELECQAHLRASPGRPLRLELSDTSYADRAGRELLRQLAATGVVLLGPSTMILDSLHEDEIE